MNGSTLYGLDITVHPDYRRQGIGRAFYDQRFDVVRRGAKLVRFGTGCRLPDFRSSGLACPADYAERVAGGMLTDRTLTPLLRYGLTYVGVIDNYMVDEESGDAAALLEWIP
jgi:GNAT superfamily N-acetyltransferase